MFRAYLARTGLFAALLGSVPTVSFAGNTTVEGTLLWQDGAALFHPGRDIRYEVWSDTLAGPNLRASGNLSDAGKFTAVLPFDALQPTAYIKYYAQNSGGYVASDVAITQANIYNLSTGSINLVDGAFIESEYKLGTGDDANNSFAVADGILTGQRFLNAVRPGGSLPSLPARFPQISTHPVNDPPTSYYSANKIRILEKDRWDFDVIGHEFSHYAHDKDRLTNSPGGNHMLGVSNIPARGKGPGTKLAWGEGVGNYMGVQTSVVDTTGPTTLANYGDTNYTDTLDSSNNYNLETNAGAGNGGEGDEVSVSRILWDIYDAKNETHDRISRGAAQVYSDLIGARVLAQPTPVGRLSSLHQVNDYYQRVVATDDIDRRDYGAIFEAYNVSPHITGSLINDVKDSTDVITVEWDRQNNNANDTFRIFFWNEDMTVRIIQKDVVGDVTSYTLTPAEKALLKQVAGGDFIQYVVIGSDLKDGTGAAYAAADQTGNYWSDSQAFMMVPEPASMSVVAMTLCLARRRR